MLFTSMLGLSKAEDNRVFDFSGKPNFLTKIVPKQTKHVVNLSSTSSGVLPKITDSYSDLLGST